MLRNIWENHPVFEDLDAQRLMLSKVIYKETFHNSIPNITFGFKLHFFLPQWNTHQWIPILLMKEESKHEVKSVVLHYDVSRMQTLSVFRPNDFWELFARTHEAAITHVFVFPYLYATWVGPRINNQATRKLLQSEFLVPLRQLNQTVPLPRGHLQKSPTCPLSHVCTPCFIQ